MDQKFIILPEDVNKGNTKDLRRSSNAIIKIGNYFRQSSEVCRRSRDILITLIFAISYGVFQGLLQIRYIFISMVSRQTRAAS